MIPEFGPVKAIGHVLRSLFGNIGFAVRFSWPWMVFVLVLQVLAIILFPGLNSAVASGEVIVFDLPTQFLVVIAVTFIASLIAFSSISVNWHRYILLDEEVEGWDRLRLDAVVMRYIGNLFLAQFIVAGFIMAGVVAMFVMLVVVPFFLPTDAAGLVSGFVMLVYGLWCIAAAQRIFVKLPAVAVEREDYGFRDAWDDTKGYSLGLIGFGLMQLAIVVLCVLPAVVLSYAMGVHDGKPTMWSEIAQACLLFPVSWVIVILSVTSLTTLYGIFGDGREV